ncbi:MAG: hypothetical protein DRI86_05225 [Bacteroidetes bacterium]|nr:MAG: hypothetical protein DRI86_05225 [Bacteroidota bacterium]
MKVFKDYFFDIIRLYIFWILVFLLSRIAFIISNFDLINAEGAKLHDLFPILYYSLELDLSMASYFMLINFILLSIDIFVKTSLFQRITHAIQYVFIFIYLSIVIGEIGLYPEWKMKLNSKALEYLKRPSEILESNKTSDTIWQTLLFIILFIVSLFLYKYLVKRYMRKYNGAIVKWLSPIIIILTGGLIFVGMRGGLQEIPISQSQSYFSKYNIVNDISVNTGWNLVYNILKTEKISNSNIFISMNQNEADEITKRLHKIEKDTTISILNISKPNIVFLIMESWSADMISSLGGKKGASNNFDELAKQGMLFTHCYSSGNRSQQGLASILGGFPALPITTLTATPEKMRQTETITTRFNDNGYFSAFYYGGSLRYGNIKAYLIHNQFQEIEEEGDIDSSIPRGKLGVHDGYMFEYLLKKIDNAKQPFFINYFTMSSHSPYDQPMKNIIDWGDSEDDFHNSFYYSDSCLGDFMKQAKDKDWYKNTLFVIVADHSHQTYTHRSVETADYRHIPMLFVGGALKKGYINTTYDDVCSQTDIGTTLLKQLKIDADSFYWSKNIMNPYSPKFAYFEINQGFGMIKTDGYVSYDYFANKYNYNTFENDSLRDKTQKEGAAYLQTLFQEFIDL